MKHADDDTIAAVATGAGGGIGIVRISGPEALAVASRIYRDRAGRLLEDAVPFLLVLGTITDPASAEPIDEVLAVRMPAGRSYTGEPTVEIQAHGGRLVLESVLQATLRAGARHASPGEFTKRAFLSGRLDLTQAEAVAELIGAESAEARRGALHQLHGALAGTIQLLRDRLLDLVAHVEAAIDFDEEEPHAGNLRAAPIVSLAGEIRKLASRPTDPSRAPNVVRVAFAGRTNSGKSSIFNMLLRSDRSIVSPRPGTTRDYIEESLVFDGASVALVDTAGVRATDDEVEAEGVRRSIQKIREADIVVVVFDGSEPNHPEDRMLFETASDRAPLVVISKADLPRRFKPSEMPPGAAALPVFTLSTVTGEGFPSFTAALASGCGKFVQAAGPPVATPNVRHRDALERSACHLDAAAERCSAGDGVLDLTAVELHAALAALGEITGDTASDEVLERIFSRFCVGK